MRSTRCSTRCSLPTDAPSDDGRAPSVARRGPTGRYDESAVPPAPPPAPPPKTTQFLTEMWEQFSFFGIPLLFVVDASSGQLEGIGLGAD